MKKCIGDLLILFNYFEGRGTNRKVKKDYFLFSVIVENSLYSGHNKTTTRTVIAKKTELTPVLARKSPRDTNIDIPRYQPKHSPVQRRACDSTVKDPDLKNNSEKRKIFSCDFDGCDKKYTKLSHLKVRRREMITRIKT